MLFRSQRPAPPLTRRRVVVWLSCGLENRSIDFVIAGGQRTKSVEGNTQQPFDAHSLSKMPDSTRARRLSSRSPFRSVMAFRERVAGFLGLRLTERVRTHLSPVRVDHGCFPDFVMVPFVSNEVMDKLA